jgi:hypothetical protein
MKSSTSTGTSSKRFLRDRHFQPAPTHHINERGRLAFQPLLAPIDHQAADGGIGLHRNLGILDARRADDLKSHPLDGGDDLGDAQAFEILGLEGRRGKQKREALDEVHWMRVTSQICG